VAAVEVAVQEAFAGEEEIRGAGEIRGVVEVAVDRRIVFVCCCVGVSCNIEGNEMRCAGM